MGGGAAVRRAGHTHRAEVELLAFVLVGSLWGETCTDPLWGLMYGVQHLAYAIHRCIRCKWEGVWMEAETRVTRVYPRTEGRRSTFEEFW